MGPIAPPSPVVVLFYPQVLGQPSLVEQRCCMLAVFFEEFVENFGETALSMCAI